MPPSSRGGWSPRRRSDRLRRAQRGPGGGGCTAAELLRSVKKRTSPYRVSPKFALTAFSEVRSEVLRMASFLSRKLTSQGGLGLLCESPLDGEMQSAFLARRK